MKTSGKVMCNNCHQPFHGLTACDEAASPRIKKLLAQARDLRGQLVEVEAKLFGLDYNHYCYITGVIKRRSETNQ